MSTLFTCPVCQSLVLEAQPYERWPPPDGVELVPPYEAQLGRPSYEVCPVCAFEFGFDDNPGGGLVPESFASYRASWESGPDSK